jgi:hypothetical protein
LRNWMPSATLPASLQYIGLSAADLQHSYDLQVLNSLLSE